MNGSGVYDANNSGDAITGGSLGLCAYGTATGFVYNTGTHTWSWSCTGSNGGSGVSCSASELWCGDGVVQTGNYEECEIGQSGCSLTCAWYRHTCADVGFNIQPATGFPPFSGTATFTTPTGYNVTAIYW